MIKKKRGGVMVLKDKKYDALIKNVLQFSIFYKLMILFFFSPLLRFILKEYLSQVSVSIAFNQNMIGVFLSIPGIIILLVLLLAIMLLVYYNLYVVIQIVILEYRKQSYHLKDIVLKSFQDLKNIHKPTFILSGLYLILLLPLVHVGYLNNYIPRWNIPPFIFKELQLTGLGQILIFFIYMLYYGLFIVMIFVPFYLIIEHDSLITAVKKSYQMIKQITFHQKIQILLWIVVWVVIEIIMMSLLPYPLLHNRDFNIYFIKYFVHFASFRYSVIQYIIVFLLSVIAMIFFLRFLASLFCQYETHFMTIQDVQMDTTRLQQTLANIQNHFTSLIEKIKQRVFQIQWIQTYKKTIRLVCIVCVIVGSFVYLHQDSRLHKPYVIGHRGSGYVIENTFEAVENANQCGSDFAEIDIQLSQDQIPVVYHDTTMSRLSDSSSPVSKLSAQEFENLSLHDQGLTASPITLEHLIQKMQEQQLDVKLLIEFKPTNDNYRKMVDEVVKIIQKYHFESQAIFMSLHYQSVAYLQHLYPKWWVGYCIYGSIGDIDNSIWDMDIDFLAIEENRASTSLIQKATSQMIPIYIWTVDNGKKMKQYLDMGVSGLITNYPDKGRKAIDEYLKEHPYSYYYEDIEKAGYPA